MNSYSLIAPAKINLYLEILGHRPDDYHELVMVMQSIDLADRLELRSNGTDRNRVYCNHPLVPLDQTTLADRAANLMSEEFPKTFANYGGVDITIDKRIPVAAGLAGGSTDGAAVLVGINLIWELGLTHPELQELGAKLGSDVPFCIAGGTAIATGRGEQLDPIEDLDNLWVVLGKYRHLTVSTAWAYQTYRQKFASCYLSDTEAIQSQSTRIHSSPLVQAIAHKDAKSIGKLLHNDLEKVVLPEFPEVGRLRDAFTQSDTLGAIMSGSGPIVFALCASQTQAEKVKQQVSQEIADPELEFWVTKLASTGIQVS